MPTFKYITGATGSVIISSPTGGSSTTEWPADSWEWDMDAGHIELPTVSSNPFVDTLSGLKRLAFKATGTAATDFNPFSFPTPIPYLNTYVKIAVVAQGTTQAYCPNCLVIGWNYKDDADGSCKWTLQAIGSWRFTNLANTFL